MSPQARAAAKHRFAEGPWSRGAWYRLTNHSYAFSNTFLKLFYWISKHLQKCWKNIWKNDFPGGSFFLPKNKNFSIRTRKKYPKLRVVFSAFFVCMFFLCFFSNFVPDLGDQLGYNRLYFWAGRRPLKKRFCNNFSDFFPTYFLPAYPFIAYPQKWSKNIFWTFYFFPYLSKMRTTFAAWCPRLYGLRLTDTK